MHVSLFEYGLFIFKVSCEAEILSCYVGTFPCVNCFGFMVFL